ncbi:MAG: ATP-binding cassette domain-containing protein, partial [Saprospiraceae bacterium]|nr:ATP-binding cassette domain-containing protein [Saprospiraceae bacterium]
RPSIITSEKRVPLDPAAPGLAIQVNDVTFTYPGHNKYNLKEVNLQIDRRERILICGANGSGKSTLLNIIAGVYEVNAGSVAYNGLPKGNLNLDSLRANVGDCLSQEELFQGTLLENISMGREKVTEADVIWALSNVGLEAFVQSLDQGYNTVLDPQGKRLPRSIVQRLLVARSIAHRPALILLEDTFEHLDQHNREAIIDFLTGDDRPWTLVAVSTDPYLAARCDQIVEMKDGAVISTSSFDQAIHLFT